MRRLACLFLCLIMLPVSAAAQDNVVMAEVLEYPAPSDFSPYTCQETSCFWNLPMGLLENEAAIWETLMQPMTVVDGEQRQIVKIYSQRDTKSSPVGEVTCESQGLHILETYDDGWALVEVYSSSASKSTVRVFAQQIQGYIQTKKFKVLTPDPTYGIVIDKFTQRMHVFKEGKLFTTLLISTGLPSRNEPYNETPAGEFMIVSRSGGFWSGNLYCDMGMRINAGILIHEVPCLINEETGERYYERCERALGYKASHGCIRVQRQENRDGINMVWIWKNIKVNTKVIIWDDVGRPIPTPDYDMPVFYNPDGGKYYHMDQECTSVKAKYLPLSPLVYGDLDTEKPSLKACPYCQPPLKLSEIEQANRD